MSGEVIPRVDAMRPRQEGPTLTAPARPPDQFPMSGRYRSYLLFGLCGGFLLISGFLVLRVVWALGNGQADFERVMGGFAHPLYLGYHALAFVALVWFTLRFFGLFPKTQPFRIGPFKRPSDTVLVSGLYGLFALATIIVSLILGGVAL